MFRRITQTPGQTFRHAFFTYSYGSRSYARRKKGDDDDFYELLGVSRNAPQEEIKKAYRKKAIEKHPDQGGSSDEFSKINEAYSVLSDSQKRSIYDQYGREGLSEGSTGTPGGFDPNDIFGQFFGDRGATRGPQASPMTEDKAISITVTLEDLYKGIERTVQIRRPSVCAPCMGNGSSKPGAKKKCGRCHGTGQETITNYVGPGMTQQFITQCRICDGQGKTLRKEDACTYCRGEGYRTVEANVDIPLDPSIFNMDVIVLRSQAGCIPGAAAGDLHVQVEVRNHPIFQRHGYDLLVRQTISLSHALTGGEFSITHLDGRKIIVKSLPHNIHASGSVILLREEGMPQKHNSRGNMYVLLQVAMPSHLTDENCRDLRRILGEPPVIPSEKSSRVVAPVNISLKADELIKNKTHEWRKLESVNHELAPGVEKVSNSAYRSSGGYKKKGPGPSSSQTQCQTM